MKGKTIAEELNDVIGYDMIELVDRLAGEIPDKEYLPMSGDLPWVKTIWDMFSLVLRTREKLSPRVKSTRDHNVGNSDYASHPIQPWEVWIAYSLNPWDADMVKRLLRTKDEEGMTPEEQRIMDYKKIQHICDERIDQINDGDPYYKNLKIQLGVDDA